MGRQLPEASKRKAWSSNNLQQFAPDSNKERFMDHAPPPLNMQTKKLFKRGTQQEELAQCFPLLQVFATIMLQLCTKFAEFMTG